MENKPSNWEQAKAAGMSIFIGAIISLITIVAQYAIAELRDIPTIVPGSAMGMLKYLSWRILHHNA